MSNTYKNLYYARVSNDELLMAQLWLDLNALSYEIKEVADYLTKQPKGFMVIMESRSQMINFRIMMRQYRSGV